MKKSMTFAIPAEDVEYVESIRIYNVKMPIPKCLNCGKLMKPVKDSIAKKYTGYLWRCDCMPKGIIVSIG